MQGAQTKHNPAVTALLSTVTAETAPQPLSTPTSVQASTNQSDFRSYTNLVKPLLPCRPKTLTRSPTLLPLITMLHITILSSTRLTAHQRPPPSRRAHQPHARPPPPTALYLHDARPPATGKGKPALDSPETTKSSTSPGIPRRSLIPVLIRPKQA